MKGFPFQCLLGVTILLGMGACGGGNSSSNNVAVEGASPDVILNPLKLQQFGNPLTIIPVAPPNSAEVPGSDYYNVTVQQTSNYDFGLRQKDGTNFLNPVTGAPIRTTVWGYNVNGIATGYLGATIEAHSSLDVNGKQTVVKYVNDLRHPDGSLLTKHLLTVDHSLEGAEDGEPDVRIVTHLHGGHSDAGSDGYPMAWVTNDPNAATGVAPDPVTGHPGRPNGNTVTYTYSNDQIATHLWFHDHAMGITRLNAYAGLAANYLVRDDYEAGLQLPSGAQEVVLTVQDKSFNEDGSLRYTAQPLLDTAGEQVVVAGEKILSSKPEFFGNTILVNGKVWPYLDVEPRKYRFRMLNGSDSRFYNLWLKANSGSIPANAMKVIANEGGLLPATITTLGYDADHGLLMAPAERYDFVIDFNLFPAGTTLTLRNNAPTPYPSGDPVADNTTGRIMQFRISKVLTGTDTSLVPVAPRAPVRPAGWAVPAKTVYFDLQEFEEFDRYLFDDTTGTVAPRLKQVVNGRLFMDPFDVDEQHPINTVEDWVIINGTEDIHPMHVHLNSFQLIEKGTILASNYAASDSSHLATVTGGLASLLPNEDNEGNLVVPNTGSPYSVNDEEQGWKETFRVPKAVYGAISDAGVLIPDRVGYIRARVRFDKLGTYMFHCHILAHEENAMMRPFQVVP